MEKTPAKNTGRMVGVAILTAMVVVLQAVAGTVKFGVFPLTLTLVPIIIGAAVYGVSSGAVLGTAFGAVVLIFSITGIDPSGNILWAVNPFLTAFLCVLKGTLAGCAAGLFYKMFSKKNKYIGVVCAAVACPVVNTGIFLAGMLLFFRETLSQWAGGSDVLYFVFSAIVLVNFLPELLLNIVLSPAAARVINLFKKNIFQ